MRKRILSASFALVLMLAMAFSAFANGLPFQKIPAAPENLVFLFTYPNEGHECIEAVFDVPDELSRIASLSPELQEKYYGTAFESCVQFDWSVDSRDAFHADKSWDDVGGSYPIQKIDGSFIEKSEVFWFAYPEAVERCAPGVTQQKKDGKTVNVFDFSAHKLYVRARFFVYTYADKTCTVSDWSDICEVSKESGAEKLTVPKAGDSALTLSKAAVDGDTLRFTVGVPDTLRRIARALMVSYGTQLNLESQMRAKDGMWTYWDITGGDRPYHVGERETTLPDGGEGTIRLRLVGTDPTDGSAIMTAWSDLVTVRDGKAGIEKNDDPFDEKAAKAREEATLREANKCSLCGICPFHPFGICMFIWLAVLLLVVLIVVYNVHMQKKKKQRQAQIKAREEASRKDNVDKTGSFINTDRIQLTKRDDNQEDKNHED